jgi:hypothetical protein
VLPPKQTPAVATASPHFRSPDVTLLVGVLR